MTIKSLSLLFTVALLTCGTGLAQVSAPVKADLDKEASAQRMHWSVTCSYDDFGEGARAFFAEAVIPGHSFANYPEDGGMAGYGAFGPTQEEAARALLTEMRTHHYVSPPQRQSARMNKKTCPPPVEGGVAERKRTSGGA